METIGTDWLLGAEKENLAQVLAPDFWVISLGSTLMFS